MLQRLPKPVEIALFAAMAVICAAFVFASQKHDSALFFAAVPLFLVCAIMGYRRNEQLTRAAEAEVVEGEETVS